MSGKVNFVHENMSPKCPLTHFQLVDVLRTRNNKAPMFQSSHIKADEVQDGTFEEIILDMKKKPFRAEQNGGPAGTDHMRKSIRKVNGRARRFDDSIHESKNIYISHN